MTPADPRAAAIEKLLDNEVLGHALDAANIIASSNPKTRTGLAGMRAVLVEALLALPVAECEICRDCDSVKGSNATICDFHYRNAILGEAEAENELALLKALPVAETGWHEEKAKLQAERDELRAEHDTIDRVLAGNPRDGLLLIDRVTTLVVQRNADEDRVKAWQQELEKTQAQLRAFQIAPSASVFRRLQAQITVAETGWQPIETAPKDGTVIIIYAKQPIAGTGREWNGIHAAKWNDGAIGNGWGHGWRLAEYQNLGEGVSGNPTHWMPLPAPPEPPEGV